MERVQSIVGQGAPDEYECFDEDRTASNGADGDRVVSGYKCASFVLFATCLQRVWIGDQDTVSCLAGVNNF